jgi:hypothetical protein
MENTASIALLLLRDITAVAEMRSLCHCLATGLFTEPFPSSGCPFWLHNSGFQQTCYNILHMLDETRREQKKSYL